MRKSQIVVVTSGFPRRSETFLLNELIAMQSQGLLAAVFATKAGDCKPIHPQCPSIIKRVHYLPVGTPEEQSKYLVEHLDGIDVTGIHGYFAHIPAEVALLAAKKIGVPYGFSTHALDARKITTTQMKERADGAACVIACNHDVSKVLFNCHSNFNIIPHGVDNHRFRASPLPYNDPIRLISVGRLVEKKGFDILIKAVKRLSFPFYLKIIGAGLEYNHLAKMITDAGLSTCVELCSPMTHAQLPVEYAQSDIVVVPSIVDRKGDCDGLPNVLLEGMASARPVIASDVGAISSAIVNGKTGILLPQKDDRKLADAIKSLASSLKERRKLGLAARKRVEDDFELGACTDRLCRFLAEVYAQPLSIESRYLPRTA
ncbi:MAG: glycosyltransferase [Nitrospiria bacterium]